MERKINKYTEARLVNSNMIGEVILWVGISFRKDETESGVRSVLKNSNPCVPLLEVSVIVVARTHQGGL